jgi:hypothetical protein
MAIRINNLEVIDDNKNANVTHMNISFYGEIVAESNTSPTTTPPHAGTVAAYYAGGANPAIPQIYAFIERLPFTTGTMYPEGIVGNLQIIRKRGHSSSSETHGYAKSGDGGAATPGSSVGLGYYFSVDKFPFVSGTSAIVSTIVGDMVYIRSSSGGGVASPTHAYSGSARVAFNVVTGIERFPFANETVSQQIGENYFSRNGPAEFASLINGYMASGTIAGTGAPGSTVLDTKVQKYNFAAEADATDVGNITVARWLQSGLSSNTYGYTAGGVSATPAVRFKTIDKFNFATEGIASLVGDLTANNGSTTAMTSKTDGYVMGGATSNNPPAPVVVTAAIDKFPFATDRNASTVGNLWQQRIQGFGLQD